MTSVRLVRVRRTGGFAGRVAEGSLDLTGPDDRVPEVRDLVASLEAVPARPADNIWPDSFVYTFEVDDAEWMVPEYLLPPALRRLVELLLDQSR